MTVTGGSRLRAWVTTIVVLLSTLLSEFSSTSMLWPGSQTVCADVAVTVAVNPDHTPTTHILDYRITAGHSHGPPANPDVPAPNGHTYYVIAGETPVLVHNCGTGPDGLIDLDLASQSGSVLGRGGYSTAGRALQKHADRPGTGPNWPRPQGTENPAGWNSAGQDMLDEILTNPASVAQFGYGRIGGTWQDTLDVFLPDGWGARFDLDGIFSGFLD